MFFLVGHEFLVDESVEVAEGALEVSDVDGFVFEGVLEFGLDVENVREAVLVSVLPDGLDLLHSVGDKGHVDIAVLVLADFEKEVGGEPDEGVEENDEAADQGNGENPDFE